MFDDAGVYDGPIPIVDAFASYFESVYAPYDGELAAFDPNDCFDVMSNSCLDVGEFSEPEVERALREMKSKHTSGHDLIPCFLLKDCSAVFTKPLTVLFNLALKTCTFPSCWKLARVCPIFKKGDTADVANYRPIAILSSFSKAFERALYNRIFPRVHRLIAAHQHGFMPQRSTMSNLLQFTQFLSDAIDDLGQIDVVYTDFSKAFDRINHVVLLRKLCSLGCGVRLILFLKSYLASRCQFVSYNGFRSRLYMASSGVPQGSNLGPLLFLLFINDLPGVLSCHNLLFADDLKIYLRINNIDDCLFLQDQLHTLFGWCVRNKLELNISKCKVVTFTRRCQVLKYDYHINLIDLARCETIDDLGVTFDTQLTFVSHIHSVLSSANRMLGLIIRNCRMFNNVESLKILFYSLVRSRLEYCSLVWYPICRIHVVALEGVQRRFLKFLYFRGMGVYPQRGLDNSILLSHFDVDSLSFRRISMSITFLYKLVHNVIDSPELLSMLKFRIPRSNSRLLQTFYCQAARTNIAKKSPLHVMTSNFNNICSFCDVHSSSLREVALVTREFFSPLL